ncbi:MAG TPA: PDZ domain-containing protein [Candidatus Kapabacteria bacterium]|nr:PDZ domain-containing protein [Candidatus Kapabacteria bacterium]
MTHIKKFLAKRKMIGLTTLMMVLMVVSMISYLSAEGEKEKGTGQGYLGVNIEKVQPEDQKEFGVSFGVLVSRVVKGEAAEKAGIKKYDVIQYVNDEKIRRPEDLTEMIRESKPGSEVKIKLVREGKEQVIPVIVGELKPGEDFQFLPPKVGKEFKEFRFKSRGAFLGVNLQSLENKDLAEYFGVKADGGALVLKIDENSPAEKAGFKAGDVIIRLHDKEVANPEDARKILGDLEKGDKVEIQVIRHKNKMTLNAELDEAKWFFGPTGFFNERFPMPLEVPEPQGPGCCMRAPQGEQDPLKREELVRKRGELLQKREEMAREIEKKMDKVDKKVHKTILKIKENSYI